MNSIEIKAHTLAFKGNLPEPLPKSLKTVALPELRVRKRLKQRTIKLKAPIRTWGEIATPFLRINSPHPWFDISKIAPPNDTCDVAVSVRNEGNASSYFTVVELLEGDFTFINSDLIKDCELTDRKIVTLHPGEEKQVTLKFTRNRSRGQAIGICYDPFLDPKKFDNGIGFGTADRKNAPHAVRYGFKTS